MRIGWGADHHWEYFKPGVRENKIIDYCDFVNKNYDLFVNCGDQGDARFLKEILELLGKHLKVPYYFVLGNNDYYHSFKDHVESLCIHLSSTKKIGKCIYGPSTKGEVFTSNGEKVKLVFCNGFANGEPYTSTKVNDELFIGDLTEAKVEDWYNLRLNFSCDSVVDLKQQIKDIKHISELYIFTHVPPIKEACLYESHPTKREFLPFFCDKYLGLFLEDLIKYHPTLKIKIFCGHTHHICHYTHGNLEVFVTSADYSEIVMNEIIL